MGLPDSSDNKESGDPSLIPGLGRSLWRGEWMDTHSSILAWRIPWTEGPEGPGELQSMRSQRVGHD